MSPPAGGSAAYSRRIGTVDHGMAIGTPGKGLASGTDVIAGGGNTVVGMTLLAKKGYRQLKKIVVDRTMRRMTRTTVFRIVGVLIEEGAGLFRMAAPAGLSLGNLPQVSGIGIPMRFVAITAVYPTFLDRMPAGQRELGSITDMATHAKG